MRRVAFLSVALACVETACGGPSTPTGEPAPVLDAGGSEGAPESAPPADAPDAPDATAEAGTGHDEAGEPMEASVEGSANDADVDGEPDAAQGYVPGSLASCWTDAACPRVMAVAHGGAWDAVDLPYDSNGAIDKAYAIGCDGVKVDVRVTKDDVPVIAHSSPIEYYESLDCSGRKIEEMTADEVTKCHRFPSLTERFQTLDDVLNRVRGKMVVQLCVKESKDYGRTIEAIHAQSAEDFAFIELSTPDLQNIIPGLAGSDSVWYLVNVASDLAEVDTLLDVIRNARAFMYEFDPTVDVSSLTPGRLHPAGVRSFTYDDAAMLSVAKIQSYFESGYDVVSTQSAANAVQARKAVHAARGVTPP
jgi:hypothetical protein